MLWICAILLGFAVGHRYYLRYESQNNWLEPPDWYGYNSKADMDHMLVLSKVQNITSISSADLALMAKYAKPRTEASLEVCAVLENIDSEYAAEACLPIAESVIADGKSTMEMSFILSVWEKRGLSRAAAQLVAMEKRR